MLEKSWIGTFRNIYVLIMRAKEDDRVINYANKNANVTLLLYFLNSNLVMQYCDIFINNECIRNRTYFYRKNFVILIHAHNCVIVCLYFRSLLKWICLYHWGIQNVFARKHNFTAYQNMVQIDISSYDFVQPTTLSNM